MNMVLTKGKIPSYGAKSTGYQRVQLNPPETIYDGRAPLNAVQSTVAPPIHLFHPIFDYFETHMNDPNLQLRNSDLIDVKKFMQTTSILFSSEKEFSSAVDPLLEILLDHQFIKGKNTEDRVSADNVIEIESGLLLVEEAKLAIGEGGCDPSTQVCISMRRHWIDRSVRKYIARLILVSNYLTCSGNQCGKNAVAQVFFWQWQARGYVSWEG